MGATTIWTVGHSSRAPEALIDLLREPGIELVADVRTVPRSARNPQFDRDRLAAELRAAGIEYRHERRLGGFRRPAPDSIHTALQNPGFRGFADHMQTETFAACIEALVVEAESRRVALLCAEAEPWRCHRSLIADALTVRGVEVRHVVETREEQRHRLTPFARVDGLRVTYPGLT